VEVVVHLDMLDVVRLSERRLLLSIKAFRMPSAFRSKRSAAARAIMTSRLDADGR
jgi:hypothetical protein